MQFIADHFKIYYLFQLGYTSPPPRAPALYSRPWFLLFYQSINSLLESIYIVWKAFTCYWWWLKRLYSLGSIDNGWSFETGMTSIIHIYYTELCWKDYKTNAKRCIIHTGSGMLFTKNSIFQQIYLITWL